MQFFILMIDYGRKGLEAVVQPELTRRAIVEQVRDILAEGRNRVAFVKFVDGNFIEDVTEEITGEASYANCMAAIANVLYADETAR